jgi:hypothetical protein
MSFEAKCRTVLNIYQVGVDQPSQELKTLTSCKGVMTITPKCFKPQTPGR